MASLSTRDTVQNLCRKGFEKGREGKHTPYNYRTISGKKTSITTHISHTPSHKTLDDRLISSMAQQCGLSRSDFISFAKCTMTQQQYEGHLRSQGLIKPAVGGDS